MIFESRLQLVKRPDEAYSAILNVNGWWVGSNEGECGKVGDEFIHRDGEAHYCKLEVTELLADKKVTWLVLDNYFNFVENQDEWKNTQITFEIEPVDGQTQVHFAQIGLVPELECFDASSNAWDSLINGNLRDLITKEGD